jgi:hypothetical protein
MPEIVLNLVGRLRKIGLGEWRRMNECTVSMMVNKYRNKYKKGGIIPPNLLETFF